jgi:predicted dehydrogenase
MEPVRYGIIGLGQISAKGHVPSLQSLAEAEIVAVCDLAPESVRKTAETLRDVRTYADYRDLVTDPDVEAVLVATPNWLHREQAIAAFDADKHVFCEKPLGIDIEECEAILEAQSRSGKVLQVGHAMRCSELFGTMKEQIAAGLIGDLQMMLYREFRSPLLPGWRQTGRTGGIMLEKNSHAFDLFNWLADSEPTRAVGTGGNNVNTDSPLIDNCVVTVEYENGVRATLVMCLFADRGSQNTFDVVGDRGRLIAFRDDQRLVYYARAGDQTREWSFPRKPEGLLHEGIVDEHRAFIRSVREGVPVPVDGPSAHRTIRVALAAERAVAGDAVVEIG